MPFGTLSLATSSKEKRQRLQLLAVRCHVPVEVTAAELGQHQDVHHGVERIVLGVGATMTAEGRPAQAVQAAQALACEAC